MNKIIPSFLILFVMMILSSCKYDSAAPIRDIRFDPKVVGRLQAEGSAPCSNYFFSEKGKLKNLGTISSKYIMVSFDPDLNQDDRLKLIEQFSFVNSVVSQTSSKSAMYYTLQLIDGLNCKQAEQAIKELSKNNAIQVAAPYFLRFENGREQLIGVSNDLQVKQGNQNMIELTAPEFVITSL